jgi:threonine dehydratase
MAKITKDDLEAATDAVYRHMTPTAEICWPLLSNRTGAEVWVKHENQTPIGAFKIRGGFNYMANLLKTDADCPGVLSATRGNHGQSVALACSKIGLASTIVVPFGNNPEKNAAMNAFGTELIEHGEDFEEAKQFAIGLADERNLHMISSFHPWLAAGVGTYALEFFTANPDLHTVYVPIGQGSGICGVISARDALGLKTEVVGVVAENAASYALSFDAGKSVSTNSADTIADGMACRVPDEEALEIILKGAARVITLSEDEILEAMGIYFVDTHNTSEGAGAAPLAGLIKERDKMAGRKVGLILSGGNADRDLFTRALNMV